jgi:flagellar hook assembly protein FlgD
LPKGVFVKVRIYDILGREVATLVNEKLDAGTYNVNWDASNYPSGVYFYRIEAGAEFEKTSKMVLIK